MFFITKFTMRHLYGQMIHKVSNGIYVNSLHSLCRSNFILNKCNSIRNNSYVKLMYNKTNLRSLSSKNDDNSDVSNVITDEIEEPNEESHLKPSFEEKYKRFKDSDSRVILDVDEEMMRVKDVHDDDTIYLYQNKRKGKGKIHFQQLKRGKSGVFDVHELVQLLRDENMKDIAVIRVPKQLKYTDYMVLANATSLRHMNAVSEYLIKVYKAKKGPKDPFLVSPKDNSDDWRAVDMKNIVLHLFMKSVREKYDIETLWTVGPEYDDKTQKTEFDPIIDVMEKHIKYLQEIQPAQ